MTPLLGLCERYAVQRGHWTRRAVERAAQRASGEELAAGLAVLVDSGGLSEGHAGRLLGLTPERAAQLLRSQRVEDELRVASCPGWPLVRGGRSLTDEERSAGEAHAAWCPECRARREERDLRRRQVTTAGSATTVTATGSAVLLSALGTKAAVITVAAVTATAVGGGAVLATRSPAHHPGQPTAPTTRSSTPAPTRASRTGPPQQPSTSSPTPVVPTPRTPSAVQTQPAPTPTRSAPVVPVLPTLPVVLPTLPVPTLPVPTLPVVLPTLRL